MGIKFTDTGSVVVPAMPSRRQEFEQKKVQDEFARQQYEYQMKAMHRLRHWLAVPQSWVRPWSASLAFLLMSVAPSAEDLGCDSIPTFPPPTGDQVWRYPMLRNGASEPEIGFPD